jgi:ubiquinone/menaquinone biosynthesis C-methylase UbiE
LTSYVLGDSDKETERLNIQSVLFENETIRTLNLAGIKQGMRCLDIGCGLGQTTLLMSKLVGKSGNVVGLDINKDNIKACRRKTHHNDNVDFVAADILRNTTILRDFSPFDLVYSRFLFQHLHSPKKALLQMSKLTKDNGVIVIEELDHGLWLSYPPDQNIKRLQNAYISLLRLYGSDPFIGRKLYRVFLENDLKPNVGAYSVCVPMGNDKEKLVDSKNNNNNSNHNSRYFSNIGVLMAEVLRENILNNGLMTKQEFDKMLSGLKRYANNSTGLVLYAIAFRIWAARNSNDNNSISTVI